MLDSSLYPPAKLATILKLFSANLFAEVIIIFMFLLALKHKKDASLLLIVLVTLELFIFARGNLFFAPLSLFTTTTQLPDFGTHRYLTTADTKAYTGPHVYWNHLRVRQPFAPDLSDQELVDFARLKQELALIPANLNIPLQKYQASGYSALVLNSYANYLDSNLTNSVTVADLTSDKLAYLGVNYLVSGYPQDYLLNLPGFSKINSHPVIYQRTAQTSRVHLQKNQGEANLISYKPHLITIDTNTLNPDILVISDSYYPGWRAYLDNQETNIINYDNTFRAVAIPAGHHQLTFSYQPLSVKIGASITTVGLLLSLLLIIWPHQKLA